jgi:thiol:disulfide interchange protein DsbG
MRMGGTILRAMLLAPLLVIGGCVDAGDVPATPSTVAPAPAQPVLAPDSLPAPVAALVRVHGIEVYGRFDAPAGLQGFAGAVGQQPVAIYLTPDGEHALVGKLADADGNDAGQAALQQLVAGPMADRTWARLQASTWVADGKEHAERIVYTFSDPNCPFCNRFWQAARPWVDSGKVQLRHVLVGVIAEDSDGKAAAILGADAPEQALGENELNFSAGGIAPVAVPAGVRAKLDANRQLMGELGFQGTPGMLFRDGHGPLQRRSGLPPDADLPAVLGPLR